MTTYTISSVKGGKTVSGSLEDAISAAVRMERDLQPALGVTVDLDGETVAEVRDGNVEVEDDVQPEIECVIYAEHAAGTESAASIPAAEWDRLTSETRAALERAYPAAEVSVEIRRGVRGVGSGTTYRIDGEKDDTESADANAIAQRAWERWCATMPEESAEPAARRWTVTTDAVTTTVEARDEDEAARAFAKSEDLDSIADAADLRAWAEALGGWCRIVRQ